uniref:Uncharacterized protein n=1 Tax=Eptatretus burgeri TaxID=7764 RepID=A0A8C4WZF4_EPTBU
MNFKVPSLMNSCSGPAGGSTFQQRLGGSSRSRPARGEDSRLLGALSALARSKQLLQPQKGSSDRIVFDYGNNARTRRQSDGRANRYDDDRSDYHRYPSSEGYGGPKSFSTRESSSPVRYQSRQKSNAYGRNRSGIPVGYKGGWRDTSPDGCGGDAYQDSHQGGRYGFQDSWSYESRRGSYYGNGEHGRDRGPNSEESTMDTAKGLLRDVVDLLRLEKAGSRDDDQLSPPRRSGSRHSYGSGSSSRYDPSRSSPPWGSRGRRDSPPPPRGSSFGQYKPSGGQRAGRTPRMAGRNWDEGPPPKRLRQNRRFESNHSCLPKEKWMRFKYKYSCMLCKFSTFNDDWMEEHMNCKSHKETLELIDNMFPKDFFISAFLHNRVLKRNQEIVPKMQKEWEKTHKKPFKSQITDFKIPEGWLRQEVVRCLACRVFTTLDKKHILHHLKSFNHCRRYEVFQEEKRRVIRNEVFEVYDQPNLSREFQKFKQSCHGEGGKGSDGEHLDDEETSMTGTGNQGSEESNDSTGEAKEEEKQGDDCVTVERFESSSEAPEHAEQDGGQASVDNTEAKASDAAGRVLTGIHELHSGYVSPDKCGTLEDELAEYSEGVQPKDVEGSAVEGGFIQQTEGNLSDDLEGSGFSDSLRA